MSLMMIEIHVGPFRYEQSSEATAVMLAITECLPKTPIPVTVRLARYDESEEPPALG